MPQRFYVAVEGSRTGAFPGTSTHTLHQHETECFGLEYEAQSPQDAATGRTSGRRQHGPVVLSLAWGPTVVHFFRAFATNEALTTVTFSGYDTDPTGIEQLQFRVTLRNAIAVGFRKTIGEPAQAVPGELQARAHISLSFEQIELSDAESAERIG